MSIVGLAYVVGALLVLCGLAILLCAQSLSSMIYRCLRNEIFGLVVFCLGGLWFLYEISCLSEADFGQYRGLLILLFGSVLVACCIYWRDWLSVRGLSLISLLLMNQCLAVGYMKADVLCPWVALFCYIIIIGALFFGTYPYRVGDFLRWSERVGAWPMKLLGALSVTYGTFILYLSVVR